MSMKFVNKDGKELEFSELFNFVESSLSPFKEIIKKSDLSGNVIKIEEEEIKFEDVFTLQINVKKVGSVSCLFKKDNFNKEEVVNNVTNLKEIKVKDIESAKTKVKCLLEIVNSLSPIAIIFKPNGDYQLDTDQFKELSSSLTFFIQKVDEEVEETGEEKKKIKLDNPFKVLAKDKYHFIFALVASFLIGFASSVAIFDIYLGKLIYIFFFVCAAAGMTLNAFIYNDSIKKNKIISTHFILTGVSTLIGLGLSVGGYLIFESLAKDKPIKNPNLMLIIVVALGLALLSIGIAFLIRFIKSKKRAK